jgi:hypothetical protein
MRRDLWKVSEAMGVVHPGLITPDDVDILDGLSEHRTLRETYGYDAAWGRLGPDLAREVVALMAAEEQHEHSPTRDDSNLAKAEDSHESGRLPSM